MHDYHKLDVWRRSRALAVDVYRVTKLLPAHEQYGLVSQMRRAAVSIPSNVAEGAVRASPRDFRRYLRMASASAGELETQLYVCADVRLLSSDSTEGLLDEISTVRKMLFALERSILDTSY